MLNSNTRYVYEGSLLALFFFFLVLIFKSTAKPDASCIHVRPLIDCNHRRWCRTFDRLEIENKRTICKRTYTDVIICLSWE